MTQLLMGKAAGFEYAARKNGEVVITRFGRRAAVLRGAKAERFLEQLNAHDPQQLMARVTGNYKRGNEKR